MNPDTPITKKKVCLLGAFAAGKTSLVRRYVHSIFSEQYHTSIGVKVDQKIVESSNTKVNLLLWDLAGLDEFQEIDSRYLRGSAGFIVVVDGTRRDTLDHGLAIQDRAIETVESAKMVFALNKADMEDEWELGSEETPEQLVDRKTPVVKTSAKTGQGVDQMFTTLVTQMMNE